MVCVVWAAIFFPETDSNTEEAMVIASFPEILITAIAQAPEGVANATIVSVLIMICYLKANLGISCLFFYFIFSANQLQNIKTVMYLQKKSSNMH